MSDLHSVRAGQGPLVVLSHSLGCDLHMWDAVSAQLEARHTVLRYDHRGHGRSVRAAPPLSIEDLADDALALIRQACGDQPVRFVGLSMGGMVAQSLAARHPAAVASLVIANSASHYGEAARAPWQARVQTVRAQGMAPIIDGVLQRWFTPAFLGGNGADDVAGSAVVVRRTREQLERCDAASYAACCEAVAAIALRAGNAGIRCPTLVIAGTRDEATPPAMSHAIVDAVAGAELRMIDAAHLSAVEKPREFVALLEDFWRGL